jgi:hypothetical protein
MIGLLDLPDTFLVWDSGALSLVGVSFDGCRSFMLGFSCDLGFVAGGFGAWALAAALAVVGAVTGCDMVGRCSGSVSASCQQPGNFGTQKGRNRNEIKAMNK